MARSMKLFTPVLLTFVASAAMALKPSQGLDRFELERAIESQSGVDHATAVRLVDALADQFKTQPGQRIPVQGFLYTSGLNFGLLRDSDTWLMDAWIQDESGRMAKSKSLYEVYFENGGIKAQAAYKFMFTFIPAGVSVKDLDGAIFGGSIAGRGIGVTWDPGVVLEGSWLTGVNRPGSLLQVGIALGFGKGVQFPRMTFHLRRVQ